MYETENNKYSLNRVGRMGTELNPCTKDTVYNTVRSLKILTILKKMSHFLLTK